MNNMTAKSRGVTIGTEVTGNLGRPNTDFTGRVALIYTVNIEGFDVPAVKVETNNGPRYVLLGDVTMTKIQTCGSIPHSGTREN